EGVDAVAGADAARRDDLIRRAIRRGERAAARVTDGGEHRDFAHGEGASGDEEGGAMKGDLIDQRAGAPPEAGDHFTGRARRRPRRHADVSAERERRAAHDVYDVARLVVGEAKRSAKALDATVPALAREEA